jgi:uncharacterized membrane protein YhaH (DUF805 family)
MVNVSERVWLDDTMNWTSFLFGIRGRFGRGQWWAVQLAGGLIVLVMMAIDAAGIIIPQGLLILVALPLAAVNLFACIRRLHDRDKSGWWLLLFYVVPGVIDGVVKSIPSEPMALLIEGVALAIFAWGMVEIGFLRGTVGANRYGSDPLALESGNAQATP